MQLSVLIHTDRNSKKEIACQTVFYGLDLTNKTVTLAVVNMLDCTFSQK